MPSSSSRFPRPSSNPQSRANRTSELDAAFDGPAQGEDDPLTSLPEYQELDEAKRKSTGASLSRAVVIDMHSSPGGDVYFDAGDALPEEPPESTSSSSHLSDPLGANALNVESVRPSHSYHPPPVFSSSATNTSSATYDFERPSYFPASPRTRTSTTSGSNTRSNSDRNRAAPGGDNDPDQSLHLGLDDNANASTNGQYALLGDTNNISRLERTRFALGRFGRFVGMGIPGARYASLSQNDASAGRNGGASHPSRLVGGGLDQDGVFANLNAKPERRRRPASDNPGDRGDDDDLEEEVLPPTYEIAAADTAPPYWETTILGTPGLHSLANGLGWTAGGAHVGAIEDLIVDGLPLGNIFGFAWNLLVSMTFQFVGFLLTYLLHTTHAARFGSRAGLGITLIQYGLYLRTRASEIAEGKLAGDDADGHTSWFGGIDMGGGGAADPNIGRRAIVSQFLPRSLLFGRDDPPTATSPTTLADLFAAQADAPLADPNFQQSMSASTEWFAYILMVIGWFILLSSALSYWRLHRWGQSLVDAARRDQPSTDTDNNPRETSDDDPPIGFVHRLRQALTPHQREDTSRGHSAEDWMVFPGAIQRFSPLSRNARRTNDADPDHLASVEESDLNPSERRLLENMRNIGLLG